MPSRFLPHALFASVSLGAALLMVSNQSLWIDEAQTAFYARKSSLAEWTQAMFELKWSETLMPLGMFVAWMGGRLIGTGEWQLRVINVLWIALAGLAMGLTGRKTKLPLLLPVFLIHPFVWYYTDQARPYALQLCASAWLLYGMVMLLETDGGPSGKAVWILSLAAVAGAGASLLFVFALAALLPLGLIHYRSDWRSLRRSEVLVPGAIGLASLTILAAYYLWALRQGASGAKIWRVSPMNLGFASYELLGFSGLGPPRNELREIARGGGLLQLFLHRSHLVGLCLLALVYLNAAHQLWLDRRDKLVKYLVFFLAAHGSLLFVICLIRHFPFWGRHMTPALPFLILLLLKLLSPVAQNSRLTGKIIFGLFAVCLAASSLVLRFDPAHGNDDYRSACRLAQKALTAGKTVWWSADPETADYYGLSENNNRDTERFFICHALSLETIESFPTPDLIIRSKPDIHDPNGAIQDYLARHDYAEVHRYRGFTVWERTGD